MLCFAESTRLHTHPPPHQELLSAKEDECGKLQQQNDELVTRILEEKAKTIAQMNDMNDEIESVRRERSVRQLVVLKSAC